MATFGLNVLEMQPWQSWCAMDKCKLCGNGPYVTTFEVTWREREQEYKKNIIIKNDKEPKPELKEDYYCSEMCAKCLRGLLKQDPELNTKEAIDEQPGRYDMLARFDLIPENITTS